MAKNLQSLQLLRNGTPYTSYTEAVNGIQAAATQDGVLKLARYTQAGSDPYSGDTGGHIKTIFAFRHEVGGESGYTIYEDYKEVVDIIKSKIDSLSGSGSGSIYDQIMQEINKLNYTGVTTGDGVVVTNVTETGGKVSATAAEVGGLKLTDYSEGSESGHVTANDSINTAIAKLQNQIDAANEAKNAAIEALDANITAADGSYIDKVEQVDGKISGTTKVLPSLAEVHEDGKPIIAVSEDKGQLAASAGTINAEYVNVTGDTFTANNVQAALEEIDAAYKQADEDLKEEILGDASTSGNTLGKLEDRIEALDADAKEYSLQLITSGLSTNVKEAYKLVDADGNQSGDTINIYKDSAYKEIYLGTASDTINTTTGEITKQDGDKQSLNYAYMKADGTYDLAKVDVSAFLSESEFQSGVTAVDHIVRGVVDPSSESFLTVGAAGFKLAGVQSAIDAASGDVKSKLDELSGKTVTGVEMTGGTANIANNTDGTKKITINADGSTLKTSTAYTSAQTASAVAANDSIDTALGKLEAQVAAARAAATTKVEKDANASHITLTNSTAADGSVTYTIGESDIASKTALDAEIAARKAVEGQNGDTYAANTSANYISAATSMNDADVKLDTALKTVADSANSAQTEIDAIETAVGLNNDGTYHANTNNTYTKNATSVANAIDKLDAAVKGNADDIAALSASTLIGATMNGNSVTVSNNVAAFTAVGKQTAATTTGNEAIVVETGNDGGLTLGLAVLDCGMYDE